MSDSNGTIGPIFTDQERQEKQDLLILNMLGGIEDEEIRLETLQLVNRHEDSDMVPGEALSYADARDRIDKSRRQILEVCGAPQIARVAQLAGSR